MNIRQVLRTYSLLRQLTDDETALLETLRSLNDTERESLVVALQPERVVGRKLTTERKIEHCVACDYTKRAAVHKDSLLKDYHEFVSAKEEKEEKKSKRAASLEQQIKANTAHMAFDGGVSKMRCARESCGEYADNPIHNHLMGYTGYHEFQSSPVAHEAGAGG